MHRSLASLGMALVLIGATYSQEPIPAANKPALKPPYERLLKDDDARKATELQLQISNSSKVDDSAGAIRAAEDLLTLRIRVQGEDHYEVESAKYYLALLRGAAAPDPVKRANWRLSLQLGTQARRLEANRQDAEALPVRHRLLALRGEILGMEHPHVADCYNDIALNLGRQNKFVEAESFHQKALDVYLLAYGELHPDSAQCLNNLAQNLYDQGKAADAAPLFLKAFGIWQKVLGEHHPEMATRYNNLAINLSNLGKYGESELYLQKALELRRQRLGERHADTAISYTNLAENLYHQGKSAQALPFALRALETFRSVLGEEHELVATSHQNLAMILSSQGKMVEAAPHYQKALEIRRKLLGEGHPATAASYSGVAANLQDQGKTLEAEILFRQALEICNKTLVKEHPKLAFCHNGVAYNLTLQGKISEAEQHYQKALEIRRAAYGDMHPDTALSYDSLASNFRVQGELAEAAPLHQKALDIRRQILGEVHPSTLSSYNNVLCNLFSQKELLDAESVFRRAILAYEASRLAGATGLDRAVLQSFNPRLLLAVMEQSRAPTQAWNALEATFARGLLDEQSKAKNLFSMEEEVESRRLRDRIAIVQPEILRLGTKQPRSAEEESRLDRLLRDRQQAEEALARLAVDASVREVSSSESIQAALPKDGAMLLWCDIVLVTGVQEHWACVVRREGEPKWERLSGRGGEGQWAKEDGKVLGQLREALRSSTTSLDDIEVLVSKARAQRIVPVEEHLAGVKTLYVVPVHEMAGIPVELIAPEYEIEYVTSGTALARAAAKPKFSGKDTLLAIGDPVFTTAEPLKEPPLPPGGILVVHVVPGGAAEDKIQNGDVLLSYGGAELTNLESLQKAMAAKSTEKSIPVQIWRVTEEGKAVTKAIDLAPGRLGANLAKEPARELLTARHQSQLLLASTSRSGRIDEKTGEKIPWKELPGTAIELDRLKKSFGEQATIMSRTEASEQKLEELRKADQLKSYRYLHFATHGLANDTRAFESFLALAQDNLPKYNATAGEKYYNGELSAREVMEEWKLNADLVTLSACESGLGKSGGGDGLLGFTQAFLLAGARSVCLSLWEVDDTATSLLMDRFYQNLLGQREGLTEPMKKAAALREAKHWLKNLTAEEVLRLSADMTKSVTRGKDEKLPPVVEAKTIAPQGDLKVKPYADPRFWSAFIIVGDPD